MSSTSATGAQAAAQRSFPDMTYPLDVSADPKKNATGKCQAHVTRSFMSPCWNRRWKPPDLFCRLPMTSAGELQRFTLRNLAILS